MADFLDSEAEESDDDQMDEVIHTSGHRNVKKIVESDEEEEDDGEEVNDLIDDNPIEEDSDNESDRSRKRKKSDDEDDEYFDDGLEDDDYDLLEENLGVKVQKKRRRIIQGQDSDDEGTQDGGYERESAPRQIFEGSDNEEAVSTRGEREVASGDESGAEDSENDGFIVDDEDRPLTDKRKKKKPIFADHTLQEAQDIFGVDFDYDDFEKYEDQYYEEEDEEEDEYEDEEQRTSRIAKKVSKKRRKPKSIYEIYEPSELERAGFTDEDSKIRSQDIPERMQLRTVPVTQATEEELDEEAEWIYDTIFKGRPARPQVPVASNPTELGGPGVPIQSAAPVDPWANDEDDWDNAPTQPIATQPIPVAPKAPTISAIVDDEDDWDKPVQPTPAASAPPTLAEPADTGSSPPPAETVPPPAATTNWLDDDWDKATSVLPTSIGHVSAPHLDAEEIKGRFVPKIRKAIEFMRNQYLEVPFIAFYRKEYIQPELDINDLWIIYREDARFCQLRARKQKLISLFEKMREYQASIIMKKPDDPIPDNMRIISDDDMEHLKTIQTHEELKDVYMQFSLYYQQDVAPMREYHVKKRKEHARAGRQVEVDPDNPTQELPLNEDEEIQDGEDEPDPTTQMKRKVTGGTYGLCVRNGISAFARKFGLSPYKFAQNLRDNYQRFELDQDPIEPLDAAIEFCTPRLPTPEDVVKAGKYMMAMQISREPILRKAVREVFFERATISVQPTKKGLKEIDENHPVYAVKYLKGKPVSEMTGDTFLRLTTAEDDGLVNIKIGEFIKGITHSNYVDEMKQLYYKDEFTSNVQLWNDLRGEMIVYALETHVFPALRKELRAKLMTQAKNHILEAAAAKLRKWIEVRPYECDFSEHQEDDEDGDWLTTRGIKVLSIAYVPDFQQVAFACFVGVDGDPSEFLRLSNITKNVNSNRPGDKEEKEADLIALNNFIRHKKPHVIVIGGESRDALMIQEELKIMCFDISKEDKVPAINVEIMDNQLAKVYANSIKGMNDFREFPSLLREAVSLGRKMQDAMIEYSQLCTADDEILCLRYHPLQDHVPREELLEYLQLEFVNRVNEVGVDVNRAIALPYTSNVLQFVCGLGPRKAAQLTKVLKQNNHRLENRTQLITLCHMGPKVFINCSGFIKIDTSSLGDSTDAYVEALDSTRVHPETYEWARKMAVDALDLDDEDTNPATALEEILLAPERLKDLDLDAFAKELARQGFGDKNITLYDIRKELHPVYADYRVPYQMPGPEEMFNILTKETPETLYIGRLVVATVIGVTHKKPQGEQLDNAIPVRNEETGMWQCSFCLKNDFPDLSEVWNHFDANACPGQATGIRLRLDNGINGFIPITKLSDKEVTNPDHRVRKGQSIHCRITKIDVDRFSVECTSRTSDLVDATNEWKPMKDLYYDTEAEEAHRRKDAEVKQIKQRMTYVKRVIIHPSFKNISFRESEKLMEQMDQGDAIIRPSSKGEDHLTVTWKVCDEIYQHVDIKEQGKENAFSLGQSLWIGEEEFEDLDEIIARYVNPMASYARDILNYKYFKAFENRQAVDEYLAKEKERSANKIHYIIYPSKEFPGKFVIAYLPKDKTRHEFIGLKSDGFRFRQQLFENLGLLLKWFKEHYRDPPPQATPVAVAPARTPFATPGNNAEAVARIGAPAPSFYAGGIQGQNHVTPHYNTTTPAQAYTPYSNFPSHTPYTPTAQTPYMTPYQQAAFPTTPAQLPAQVTPGFAHPANTTPAQRNQHARIPAPARSTVSTVAGGENMDRRRAAEAWASASSHQKRHGGQSYGGRHEGEGGRTPVTRNAAQIISEGIEKTRQMSSAAQNYLPNPNHRSPKGGGRDSLRSTPKTNFSPRSMIESSLGDETPLFDEH